MAIHEKRTQERLAPNDFVDYHITLDAGEAKYEGFLANIHDNGACLMLPLLPGQDKYNIEKGDSVIGEVYSNRYNVKLSYQGEVRWEAVKDISKKTYHLIGVQFTPPVILPDRLFALSAAVN